MTFAEILSVLAVAAGLSADCFAVAVSASIAKRDYTRIEIVRVSFSFGLFQAFMPVLGWLVGRTVVDYVAPYDHWLAFALLAFVGGRMLWEALRPGSEKSPKTNIARGFHLIILSVATSIDALAVGLSFAFLDINILVAGLTIGVVAFIVTAIGFVIGRKSGERIGKRAEIVGALILIGIGLRILLTHIL